MVHSPDSRPASKLGLAKLSVSLSVAIAAAAVVVPTIAYTGSAPCVDCRRVEALNVTKTPTAVEGLFHMIPSANGIATDGYGGACVVFRIPSAPACNSNSDCTIPLTVKAKAEASSYCLENQCWVKLSEGSCYKSLAQTPPKALPLGQVVRTPPTNLADARSQLMPGNPKAKLEARVLACLNGKFAGKPPCAGGVGQVQQDAGKTVMIEN